MTRTTTYQAGPRTFQTFEEAEQYARESDWPTVAVMVDGVMFEHEVEFEPEPVSEGEMLADQLRQITVVKPGSYAEQATFEYFMPLAIEQAERSECDARIEWTLCALMREYTRGSLDGEYAMALRSMTGAEIAPIVGQIAAETEGAGDRVREWLIENRSLIVAN